MHADNRLYSVARKSASVLVAALVLGGTVRANDLTLGVADAASVGCQLPQIAFCDSFDAPSPNGAGTRAGDLDGVVWGVSRATSDDNPSQGDSFNFRSSQMTRCGATVTVAPPRDVQVCNGQMFESVNDGGAVTVLAMYPRQPFDVAGRTGTVTFDVGNDTQDSHAAWPEFVFTDQPVPAPHDDAAGLQNYARNSFGVSMAAVYQGFTGVQAFGDSWGVDKVFTTSNYQFSGQSFTPTGSVKKSVPGGPLNHVQIRMSQTHQEVWATDPGSTTFKQIAVSNASMPLTRGLVWMEDVHYNADKAPSSQANHTFAWDNFGFDGPILPRDLGFGVPDATGGSIGYLVPTGGALHVNVPGVTNLANATGALLEFNWWPHQQDSITYSLNGHASHTTAWPYGQDLTFHSETLAIPIALGDLVAGTNALTLTSTDGSFGGVSVANIDVILVAAGGGGTVGPPPPTNTPTPVPTSTPIVVPSPTGTAVPPTATAVPPTATAVVVATATSVPPTVVPNVATATPTAIAPSPTPPTSQMLMGSSATAASRDNNSTGQAEAFPYTASLSGKATRLAVYIDSTNTASGVTLGVYANGANNQPGALLTQASIAHPITGWNSVSFPGLNMTAGTQYWIALLSATGNSGTLQYRDQASGALSITSAQTNLASLPATWSSGATWQSGKVSAYAGS